MIKKTAVFALSIIMVFAMMPTSAFAEDAGEITEQGTQAEIESAYKFTDTGSEYHMEDTSGYAKEMRIYAFYLGTGEYGDAVLIESNGRYLLMDTGHRDSASKLVTCMKSVMGSEKKVDVYFSHMHGDHTGGLEKVMKNFQVGTVFFPDIELCENYYTPNTRKTIDRIYKEHVGIARNGGAEVVYLRPSSSVRRSRSRAVNTTNKFNVGAVTCTVLGPLGKYKPSDFESYVKELNGFCGTKEGHCLNNSSLCTLLQCGKIKYLATGDIEKQEEAKLAGRYGSRLNANIMKLPHHALRTSATKSFVAKVTPMWSFAQDHGFTDARKDAVNTVRKYGYYYPVATGGHAVIYCVKNNRTRVYRDYNNNCKPDDGMLNGWVKVSGRYQYYSKGYIRTGWNWIKGHAYYMGKSTGFRFTGSHTINDRKLRFDSEGRLVSHKKPSRTAIRYVTAKAGHKITVRWTKAERASRYQIYRKTGKSGSFKKIKTVSADSRSYTNSGLTAGRNYYYKVRAIRYVAGGTMYGRFSEIKKAKAK